MPSWPRVQTLLAGYLPAPEEAMTAAAKGPRIRIRFADGKGGGYDLLLSGTKAIELSEHLLLWGQALGRKP